MSHEVAMYIQRNHLLPEARIEASQGKEVGLRIVQDYLAFWIGIYRKRLPLEIILLLFFTQMSKSTHSLSPFHSYDVDV